MLEKEAVISGINCSFAIARSHYGKTIDLEGMSEWYASGYTDEQLDELEAALEPVARALAERLGGDMVSRWGL